MVGDRGSSRPVMRFLRFPRPAGTSDEEPRRRQWAFWVSRFLACLVGLVAVVVVVVVVLLRSLDQPWLKRRLQGAVRASAGVDIDYRAARVGLFSGAHIDGLVVASPAEVRPFASDLVRVGTVDARWSLGSLLLGRGPTVESLEVSDVALTVVVDEHGRTSFDALTPSGSKPAPGPTVPLSRKASKFLGTAPPVGWLDIGAVTLALVRTDHAEFFERWELRGLPLALATSLAGAPTEVMAGPSRPRFIGEGSRPRAHTSSGRELRRRCRPGSILVHSRRHVVGAGGGSGPANDRPNLCYERVRRSLDPR